MFFKRRKSAPQAGKASPEVPATGSAGTAAGSSGGVAGGVAGGAAGAESGPPTTQFLTGDQGEDRRTVQVLLEAINRVSQFRDIDSLLEYIVEKSIEITGAERGLLLLRRSDGSLQQRVVRQRGGRAETGDVRFSTTIATKVLEEVQPVRATVQSESEALELGKSVFDLKLRAVMCVPLADLEAGEGSRPTGVLYVDSRAASRQFSQRDLSLFAALAQHISVALENAKLHLDRMEKVRLEQTLELAAEIQNKLMPGVPKDIAGYEFHGWYGPAEVAAGDFYDFLRTKDGRVGVVVGDVTGHGIGPALITATAQGSLASYMRVLQDPGQAVTHLNEDISAKVEDGRFITMFLASLTPDGDLHGVNAGHAPPMIWRRANGDVETITGGGPALGMIDDEVYSTLEPRHLDVGDVLVIYTDGLTEAREPGSGSMGDENVVMFGEDGLQRALCEAAAKDLDAKGIALHLVETALELSGGEREDDITVVVVRRV